MVDLLHPGPGFCVRNRHRGCSYWLRAGVAAAAADAGRAAHWRALGRPGLGVRRHAQRSLPGRGVRWAAHRAGRADTRRSNWRRCGGSAAGWPPPRRPACWPRSRAARWAAAGWPRSGPSGWQTAVVAALEVGVAAAVTAGLANWLRMRRVPRRAAPTAEGAALADSAGRAARPGLASTTRTASTWTRGLRRGRRAARPRRRRLIRPRCPSWPGRAVRGDLLDRVDELVLAGLLGGDRVGPAQAPGERARLLAEQYEREQQDAAEQHPDPADDDGGDRAARPGRAGPPGPGQRGGRRARWPAPRRPGQSSRCTRRAGSCSPRAARTG